MTTTTSTATNAAGNAAAKATVTLRTAVDRFLASPRCRKPTTRRSSQCGRTAGFVGQGNTDITGVVGFDGGIADGVEQGVDVREWRLADPVDDAGGA